MTRRTATARFLTLAWATVQLVAPALAGLADGRAFAESASGPSAHIEAATTESCPVVHSPDCGLCRYVSGSGATSGAAPSFHWVVAATGPRADARQLGPCGASLALPFGRAPPQV